VKGEVKAEREDDLVVEAEAGDLAEDVHLVEEAAEEEVLVEEVEVAEAEAAVADIQEEEVLVEVEDEDINLTRFFN